MKKLLQVISLISILLFCKESSAGVITVDAFLSVDSVTIAHLEQFRTRVVDGINNFDGANVSAQSIPHTALDANSDPVNRWSESFNNYVYTGLLPQTGTRAGAVITAGTAYIGGMRVVKDATTPGAANYPTSNYIYVDLSNNGTFTYVATATTDAVPSVTSNSLRLARVTTSATDVTAVRDDRITAISLNIEEFYKAGMNVIYGTPTTLTVDTGIANAGSTKVTKTAQTILTISATADYISGAVEAVVANPLFVYMNSSGDVKLSAFAPTYHNTDGGTTGPLFYYKTAGNVYWRCLGSTIINATTKFSEDATVSSNIAGKVVQVVSYQTGAVATGTNTMVLDDSIPQISEGNEYMNLTIVPTYASNKLKIEVVWQGANSIAGYDFVVALFKNTDADALACIMENWPSANTQHVQSFTHYMTAGTTSPITFRVNAGATAGGTTTFNGTGGGRSGGGAMASSLRVTEYSQ
jgi:hypothetical protein